MREVVEFEKIKNLGKDMRPEKQEEDKNHFFEKGLKEHDKMGVK
jgi:hypothetical protein